MTRNASSGKPWFRSRDGLLGGVCAGVARRFDLDPLVIGILGVMLLLATCGIFGLVYLILWRVLPLEPEKGEPFEVKPDLVLSDTYGELDAASTENETRRSSASAAAQAVAGYAISRPVGSWHLPPEPPAAYYRAASVALKASTRLEPSALNSTLDPTFNPALDSAAVSSNPSAAALRPEAHPVSNTWILLALCFGFAVLTVVTMAAFGSLFDNLYWWQFWPVIFLVAGIASLISPLSKLSLAQRFARSVALMGIGTLLLRASMGISSWESLTSICLTLWPLLLCSVVFVALSFVLNKDVLSLVGAGLFAIFCILGVMFFSISGDVSSLTIVLPDRDAIIIQIH